MGKSSIFVTEPTMPEMQEYITEISDLWNSRQLTNSGRKHIELQQKLTEYLNVKNVSLFANGHLALEAAIQALKLSGEIITTPFTFASTTQAILRCGLKPVFCDIKSDDYTIDCNKIENYITENTSAIIPVHVFSNLCDVEKIQEIANKHKLKIIYDAAHSFGESYNGTSIGQFGDITMFSFHATKVFHTVEGGCLTFSDKKLVNILDEIKQFGQSSTSSLFAHLGTNAKMSEFHAAMGICNLRHLNDYITKRKNIVLKYRSRLTKKPGIHLSPIKKEIEYNYSYFPILFNTNEGGNIRDAVYTELAKNNIYAKKYFSPLTSDFKCCKKMNIKAFVPNARYISERILVLPCYPDLDLENIDTICDIILNT